MAFDVGGSGSRVALARPGAVRLELSGERAAVGADGSTVPAVVRSLLAAATAAWPDEMRAVRGVGIGATGLGSLVRSPADLAREVAGAVGAPAAAAIDAVTAHLGALDGAGGAVVVLGTGAIAVGHGGPGSGTGWRRVDGWGHLLGDRGGGASVGLDGLRVALVHHDGVDPRGAALLAAARLRFGDPTTWPGQLYTRPDRAGVLAQFASDVVELAAQGDPAAHGIVHEAGADAARSVVAALGDDVPARVALSGGLARAGGALSSGFSTTVAALRPDAEVRRPLGDPLDGALLLARTVAEHRVVPQEGCLWT
nr:BadF/BadG/BcrA/BcrD ATPase family protein [Isoptericola halotolerans]